MEEDLKILEEIKQSIDTDYGTGRRKIQAIDNVINRIKELEKLEQEHKEINGELRETVKEIEEDYTSVYLKGIYDERDKWKSKIKEKIEELEKEADYRTEENPKGRIHFRLEPCDYQIQVLQELLEKEERDV